MTEFIICDFCDSKVWARTNDYGTLKLGLKVVGDRPLRDICPFCTVWLYEVANIRRKLVKKLDQYENEIPKKK